jgi:hypothetical protein
LQKKKLNNLKEKNGNEEARNLKKKDNKINKIIEEEFIDDNEEKKEINTEKLD